jgi:hypothetical protein
MCAWTLQGNFRAETGGLLSASPSPGLALQSLGQWNYAPKIARHTAKPPFKTHRGSRGARASGFLLTLLSKPPRVGFMPSRQAYTPGRFR